MEASTRFELVMELLQSSALPLGDEAGMSLFGVRIEVPNRLSGVKLKILIVGQSSQLAAMLLDRLHH